MRAMWRLAAPVAFGLAGLLFAASAGASRGGELRGARTELPDLIRAQESTVDDATRQVDQLRSEVDDATERAGAADRRVAAEAQRSATLAAAAGLEAVRGPGMSVSLSDAPRAADRLLPEGTSPDDLVVHQQDVQAVVNALWAGGAEAMRIMDQRIISTSAVRCVGNTLILQGRVYSPPFVVTAIGDPDRMRQELDASANVALFRYYADRFGLGYETKTLTDVRLPGFAGALELQHAEAAG